MIPATEPETLLFETSPHGTLDAMVQRDNRTVYLYLNAPNFPSFGTRAVWVRNLVRGPLVVSESDVQQGLPPVMPRTHCAHPDGAAEPDANDLHFVWFEEGNGVALFESGELLAILPPWSGLDGFHGYARDCRIENSLCWPLPIEDHLEVRIRRARQYWQNWEVSSPFADYQQQILSDPKKQIEKRLGNANAYFSIDGGKWPPRGIQSYCDPQGNLSLVTIGVGMCAMPNVELSVEKPALYRRTELAIWIPTAHHSLGEPESSSSQTGDNGKVDNEEPKAELQVDSIDDVLRWMSGYIRYPWRFMTWFSHGHTGSMTLPQSLAEKMVAKIVDFEFEVNTKTDPSNPNVADVQTDVSSDETTVPFIFVHDKFMQQPLELGEFMDDPINLLWVVPISQSELKQVLDKSTSTEELLVQLQQSNRIC